MTRRVIDEAQFRALATAYPFYEVAERLQIGRRAVAVLAARYGVQSAFVSRRANAAEETRLRALAEAKLSVKAIAEQIGRSQEFVARRLKGLARPADDNPPKSRPIRRAWPIPDTTIEAVLSGRRYENVQEDVLLKECPPGRWPINGAALAAVGRFAARSHTRSAADLCIDA